MGLGPNSMLLLPPFAAAFDEDVSLLDILIDAFTCLAKFEESYLEGVFSGETLVTMKAGKGFHSEVDPFMSLQVMISVETLGTLVAFEGPIIGHWLLLMLLLWLLLVAVDVLGVCNISAVELWHHAMLHIANHGHLASGTMHVRHNGALHGGQ